MTIRGDEGRAVPLERAEKRAGTSRGEEPRDAAPALARLLGLLELEPVGEDVFRGRNEFVRGSRLFGGQVLAQALAAAARTLESRRPHSLHGYFLRSGDPAEPVLYGVERIRDGGSFTTRRVVALQRERALFTLAASFHEPEEGVEHQAPGPRAPEPEAWPSWEERARQAGEAVPAVVKEWMRTEKAFELRSEAPPSWLAREPSQGPNRAWLRARGALPEDPVLHACLVAYASDMGLVDNVYRPHAERGRPRVQVASLDHALWLHRPFRVDDWLLYHQESPVASGGRGFVRGALYDGAGWRVASVAQEGLARRSRRGPRA